MSPMLSLVAAAVMAGLAAGLLGLALFTWVGEGLRERPFHGPHVSMDSVGDMLAQAPVPAFLLHRWAADGLAARLLQAGVPWRGRAYAGARWVAIWAGGLTGAALVLLEKPSLPIVLVGLVLFGAGGIGPELWLTARADHRRREVELALPDFLDRVSLGLDAGLSFEMAFRRTAVDFHGLLGDELRRVIRQIDRGHSRSAALYEMQVRNPSPDVLALVATVNQSDKLGTSLAKALKVQTRLLRAGRRRRAQEASRRLPVLIVFPLVFFFLPALLIIYLAPPILHLFLGR